MGRCEEGAPHPFPQGNICLGGFAPSEQLVAHRGDPQVQNRQGERDGEKVRSPVDRCRAYGLAPDRGDGQSGCSNAHPCPYPAQSRYRRRTSKLDRPADGRSIRGQFVEQGLSAALHRQAPTEPPPHKLDGEEEAHLIALAFSAPPTGRKRWTLRLLANKLVKLQIVEDVSYETVRRILKKTN